MMKKILFIILAVIILAAAVLLYLKSKKFSAQLKVLVKKSASEYIGNPIQIDRIGTDIFNSLVLHNVKIIDPVTSKDSLTIKKIKVKYSVLSLIKKIGNLQQAINEISFYNPEIAININKERTAVAGLEKLIIKGNNSEMPVIPPWKINFINGKIEIRHENHTTVNIHNFDGSVSLGSYPEVHSKLAFEVEKVVKEIKIEARYHVLKEEFELWITGKKINLIELAAVSVWEKDLNFDSGLAGIDVRISGDKNKVIEDYSNLKFHGEIKIQNVLYGSYNIPQARINISPERMKIEKSGLEWEGNTLSVIGIIKDYLKVPEVLLEAKGIIQAQYILSKTKIKNVEGKFAVDTLIKGGIDDLNAEGNLYMNSGSIYGVKIKQLKTEFTYDKDKLKFGAGSMSLGHGNLIWEGVWSPMGMLDVKLMADSISLSEITGYERINGDIKGNLMVIGDINRPEINSNITIENFIIPGRELGHLTVNSEYEDYEINLNGFTMDGKYSTKARLHLEKDNLKNIHIDKLLINGPGSEKIELGGGFSFAPFKSKLFIDASDVDTSDVPGLTGLYADCKGTVNFRGNFGYSENSIMLNGQLQTAELNIKNEKYFMASKIDFMFKEEKSRIEISDINVNNYVSGHIVYENYKGDTFLNEADLSATSADVKELLILTKKDLKVKNGVLDGTFKIKDNTGKGKFTVKGLSIAGVETGDIDLVVLYTPDNIELTSFQAHKGEGSVKVSGKVFPGQGITVKFDRYSLKNRILTGNITYFGDYSDKKYEFKVKTDIELNGESWPPLLISGLYSRDEIKVKLDSENGIKGELIAKYNEKPVKIESDIWLRDFHIKKVLDILGVSTAVDGTTTGSVKIMGNIKSPIFYIESSVENGEYKGIPVSLTGSAELHSGQLNIERLTGTIGDNGNFNVTGGIIDNNEINTVCKISNFDLSLLRGGVIATEKKMSGTVDAVVNMTGSLSKPVFNIETECESLKMDVYDFKKIKGKVSYSDGKFIIGNIDADYHDGKIGFQDGIVSVLTPGKVEINLACTLKNINIAVFSIFGKGRLSSSIIVKPFFIDLRFIPEKLLINRYNLRSGLNADFDGKTLNITVNEGIKSEIYFNSPEKFEIKSLHMSKKDSVIDGHGIYDKDMIEADVRADNIEINDIIRFFNSTIDYYGNTSCNIHIGGKLNDISVGGNLSVINSKYRNIKIDNLSGSFHYSGKGIKLTDAVIKDPDFIDIYMNGTLGEEMGFSIGINRLSLSVLEDISTEINRAAGYFKGNFNINGTLEKPVITGGVSLEGGTVNGKNVIGKIRDIECEIISEGSRLNLKRLRAKWKPGIISGTGYVDFGKKPVEMNLALKTGDEKGVLIKIPYLDIPQSSIFGRYLTLPSHGEPKGSLNLSNTPDGYYLKGDITITNTHFTYPSSKKSGKSSSSILDNIILDIDLNAGESVWYENTYARVKVDGSLNFKKYPGKGIVINGLITSSEGELTYFNRDYKVKLANLKFEDTIEYLDAVAATDIQRKMKDGLWEDDVIEIIIPQSRVVNVEPRFNSAKFADSTSSEEAMELTIAGVELEGLTRDERSLLLRQEILKAIDVNLTSPLVKNILSRTDFIDVAKVDMKVTENPEDSSSLMLEGAGIELGRYVTDRFYMGYYMEVGMLRGIDNRLQLFHELDVLYRLQGSQFLKGRVSEKEKFFLGFEQQIKF